MSPLSGARRRGASPVPFVIFLLLWLVSCYFAYKYNQEYEKAERLLKRKKIEALKLGQNVPGLKELREQTTHEIRKLKKILGYMPDGKQPDMVNVEQVTGAAREKLNKYHDSAIPTGGGEAVTIKKGEKKVEILINGEYVQVPLLGQQIQADKLTDVQYQLHLDSVVRVLRGLSSRLELYKTRVTNNIAQLEHRLASIKTGTGEKQTLLQKEVTEFGATQSKLDAEATAVKSKFDGEITQAKGERAGLDKDVQALDKQIQRVGQKGNKDVQAYQNRIVEANKQKGILRRELASQKVQRTQRRYVSRAELIISTVETDQPDGEILFSDPQGAWINLGRRDKVSPGLMFFVFTPAAGDFWSYRAKVQVLRVKNDMSLVRMVHQQDRFVPVTRGDKIFNKIYRTPSEITLRNERTRVAFLGKFPQYEKRLPFIKNMLKRLGAQVDEKLTHWTTLVVVERDFEADADYLRATRDLNIEVLTVEQLREFIAY